jgi:anion-transporting  ArsA/GET3 family ATPase
MQLLASPECAFVIVAAPTPPSLAEAGEFLERLHAAGMVAGATVLNRWRRASEPLPLGAAAAADRLSCGSVEDRAAAAVVRYGLKEAARAALDAEDLRGFVDAHQDVAFTVVPELAEDVHDVAGLRRVGRDLFDATG